MEGKKCNHKWEAKYRWSNINNIFEQEYYSCLNCDATYYTEKIMNSEELNKKCSWMQE